MENRLKLRISRMFRASFGSCRSRNISDVMENAVFAPQKHKNFHMIEPLSPKARPFPSNCKPRCPETNHMIIIDNSCINTVSRRKVAEQYSPFVVSTGRMCPPASPISPLNPNYKCKEFGFNEKNVSVKKKNKNKKRTHLKKSKRRDSMCILSSSSQDSFNYNGWWFSSDDEKEDETETLFSSKSLSSDSSESLRRSSRRRKPGTRRRRAAATKSSDHMGVLPLSDGKVKDSFAVVKSSRDPYNDFRTSMVEMIIEKQIFAAKDLEQLLQCFLSLNSYHHHRIIVEVFTEIWEALFSNWC
ncbi:hypothetical protein ACOSP7_015386 [Xanthoceras sorbifolium]|uniref:Transcription repressor n=1 Tax=Xanthoceras sorbifolium TaxID=99658 RepID=A0ABQ8I6N8_9ROSI|nr:hypothetical protein JRO89_XS04G0233500 [Xanthoceras sorbifolium]